MEKEDHHHRELQLLPPTSSSSSWLLPPPPPPPSDPSTSSRRLPPLFNKQPPSLQGPPSDNLNLQLSISLQPSLTTKSPPHPRQVAGRGGGGGQVEALRWQAAEQIRMAAMEKAYAERVRELTRREMELAQAEFARARIMWERARDELARAELLKENAIVRHQVGSSTCMEITCHSCSHRFRP